MNETEMLDALDRRAQAATASLDARLQDASTPHQTFDRPDHRPGRVMHRLLPLAVAAGLAIIALVGAAIIFDDADEQGTVAGQPEGITRLALPDPGSLGYRIVGAFDGSTSADSTAGPVITMTLHSPTRGDPWEETVVTYSLPADMTTLDGQVVDVGGPEATLSTGTGTPMIGWKDGERVRFLGSPGVPVGELAILVRQIVEQAIPDGAPLPGHDIVHVAPHIDVFPMLASGATAASGDISGIAYDSDAGTFAVATTRGSTDRWRAAFALAAGTERLTVRGHDAIRADFGNGVSEISWLEADGTLVRVDSFEYRIPEDVLDRLEPITQAEFDAIVEDAGTAPDDAGQPTDGAGGVDTAPDPVLPDDDRMPLAEVSVDDGDVAIRATLLRTSDGSLELETFTEGPTGGTGTGQTIVDASSNVVARDLVSLSAADVRGVLLAGLIGPGVDVFQVVDATTGERIEHDGGSTATIDGSDHVLFLGTVGPEHRDRDLLVVATTSTGEEIRLRAPAQP